MGLRETFNLKLKYNEFLFPLKILSIWGVTPGRVKTWLVMTSKG
jgi:hypothetical protein